MGPELIVVVGAVASSIHVAVAGVGSVFWLGSVARTSKVWLPSVSELKTAGLEQASQAAEPRRQLKAESASLELNETAALPSLVSGGGAELIVVSGGVVSGAGGAVIVAEPIVRQLLDSLTSRTLEAASVQAVTA
jgi:hypothetical protein